MTNNLTQYQNNSVKKPKPTKELSDKQKQFLHYLTGTESKGDIRKAMRLAGYSDNTTVNEVVRYLKDEIREIAEMMLANTSIKAVMGLNDALENPGKIGMNNQIAAAKEILDRIGMGKKEQNTGIIIKADNLVFLPPKDSKPNTKTIELDSTEYLTVDNSDDSD